MSVEEHGISVDQMSALIDKWIFNARNRAIMKRRLCDGSIYDQIAEEFEMSDRQIKRIVYKEQERLFKHIKEVTEN